MAGTETGVAKAASGVAEATEKLLVDGWNDWVHTLVDMAFTPGAKGLLGAQKGYWDRQIGRTQKWVHQLTDVGLEGQRQALREAVTVRRPMAGHGR